MKASLPSGLNSSRHTGSVGRSAGAGTLCVGYRTYARSFMSQLLFEAPWWLWALPGAAGIFLLLVGNTRQNRQLLRAGAALLVLAVALFLVSWLVDTPREKSIKQTRALIKQIQAGDWTAVQKLLAPRVKLAV